jgi:hypothetical protein
VGGKVVVGLEREEEKGGLGRGWLVGGLVGWLRVSGVSHGGSQLYIYIKAHQKWRVVERLAGLKSVVTTIWEVDVKRCEEGREGSGVMPSCTPECRNPTRHIVRGYR